jgi:hypothetical protein
MNLWISISLSLLFLIPQRIEAECSFRDEDQSIYSLSGPVTVALKELKLLKLSHVKGVSIFHPIASDEFSGKLLPGGIFLSREVMKEMKGSLVFFDESRELGKILSSMKELKLREVKTRGLTPEEVTSLMIKELKAITKDCDKEFESFLLKSQKLSKEILSKAPKNFSAVFYLGELRNQKRPDLAMVNDGIVKWLKDQGKLKTYPSELAYVSWSAKIIHELPEETLHIGVIDSGGKMKKEFKKLDSRRINFTYPGSLIPGLSQQEAWLYLLNLL